MNSLESLSPFSLSKTGLDSVFLVCSIPFFQTDLLKFNHFSVILRHFGLLMTNFSHLDIQGPLWFSPKPFSYLIIYFSLFSMHSMLSPIYCPVPFASLSTTTVLFMLSSSMKNALSPRGVLKSYPFKRMSPELPLLLNLFLASWCFVGFSLHPHSSFWYLP